KQSTQIPPTPATVRLLPTASAGPSPTSSPQISFPPTSWTQVINDPLTQGTNGFWDLGPSSPRSSCDFTGKGYDVKQSQRGAFVHCSAQSSYQNIAFSVQMKIVAGDQGGIVFCGNQD